MLGSRIFDVDLHTADTQRFGDDLSSQPVPVSLNRRKKPRIPCPIFRPSWQRIQELPGTPSILEPSWPEQDDVICERCGWQGMASNLGTDDKPCYGYCSRLLESAPSEATQAGACWGLLVTPDVFSAAETVPQTGLAPGQPSVTVRACADPSLPDHKRACLGLAPLPVHALSMEQDTGSLPAFDDGLESLLAVPVVTRRDQRKLEQSMQWQRLVTAWRQEQQELPSDEERGPAEEKDEGQSMQAVIQQQQDTLDDPCIFWRHFVWDFVGGGENVQRVADSAGLALTAILDETSPAVAYVGITRDVHGRFRGVESRQDIVPHYKRYSSMFVLAVGWGEFAAKIEIILIRRLHQMRSRGETTAYVVNVGKGGEGSRRGVRTFVYLVIASVHDLAAP